MFQAGQHLQSKSWQSVLDQGKHYRARLGFILMSTDLAAESDFFAMAPEGVAVTGAANREHNEQRDSTEKAEFFEQQRHECRNISGISDADIEVVWQRYKTRN